MPTSLRPKAPVAADTILVGDPGRALLLAQELLVQPKMSNHARGLWGYTGRTPEGAELTIQTTGIGGPSAAAVLADLAELGVRRAVRVGTCAGLEAGIRPGELVVVTEAVAAEGSATAFGVAAGTAVEPDPALLERLRAELAGAARAARIASLDAPPSTVAQGMANVVAADMQTVAVLARGRTLEVAAAAVLIVAEAPDHRALEAERLEAAAKRAGRAVSVALST